MKNNLNKKQLIEVLLQWDSVNTSKLIEYFSISRNTAQLAIDDYKKEFSDFLEYDASHKCYFASELFQPHCTEGSISEYNQYAQSLSSNGKILAVESIVPPARNINPKLIRRIIRACNKAHRIEIGYYSMDSGSMESRIICPHTIINDGVRWHVRAYCEKNREFRDFVLSRFRDEVEEVPYPESTNLKQHDELWNTYYDLEIIANPKLDALKRKFIEYDFMMEQGVRILKTRAALIKYVIQQLNLKENEDDPSVHQIVLKESNWDLIRPHLYERDRK